LYFVRRDKVCRCLLCVFFVTASNACVFARATVNITDADFAGYDGRNALGFNAI
jgi:hypothetical protein